MKLKTLFNVVFVTFAFSIANGAATKWYTTANLDFTSISMVSHTSKYGAGISYFSIVGMAGGVQSGIQGLYASQDPTVVERCLSLAENLNLQRQGEKKAILRIQVQPDSTKSGAAQIQYCTLYQ